MQTTANPMQYSDEQRNSLFTIKFSYHNRKTWVPRHMWRQEYHEGHANYEFSWNRVKALIGDNLKLAKTILIYENMFGNLLGKYVYGKEVFLHEPNFMKSTIGNTYPTSVLMTTGIVDFPLDRIKFLYQSNEKFYKLWKENLKLLNDVDPDNTREHSKLTPAQVQERVKMYVQSTLNLSIQK